MVSQAGGICNECDYLMGLGFPFEVRKMALKLDSGCTAL